MLADARFEIRATRASPPGLAREDPERRRVYGAALAQFDELMIAAQAMGLASRPLPLFYALSQAGRAIAAARAQKGWRLRQHGLSAWDLSTSALMVGVRRDAAEAEDGAWTDSISGVAEATGNEVFRGEVTIGAIWSSLPEIHDLIPKQPGVEPSLLLVPDDPGPENLRIRTDPGHVYGFVVGFDGSGEELDAILAAYYPTSAGAEVLRIAGMDRVLPHHTPYGSGYLVRWPVAAPTIDGHVAALQRISPEPDIDSPSVNGGVSFPAVPGFEPRWLRSSVGDAALSSLLSWWTLLFGVSMLARYEPDGWIRSLDYDSSELANPLACLMEIAIDRVPTLIVDALTEELGDTEQG